MTAYRDLHRCGPPGPAQRPGTGVGGADAGEGPLGWAEVNALMPAAG